MNFTLTKDQQSASDAFISFLLSDNVEMVISGGAGVGKSTLLSVLLEQFKQHNNLLNILGTKGMNDVVITATTNKAAAVLSDMTKTDVSTIHSLLGLMVMNDYKTGKQTLTSKHNVTISGPIIRDSLIVVDECSMIDSALYGWIHTQTENCKFLYIGDHCQMAPVGEAISPVFKRELDFFRLEEIIRSKNSPPITALCQALRQTVETGTFFPIEEASGFVEYLDDSMMVAKLQEHFVDRDGDHARVLFYTNTAVNNCNALIRRMRGQPAEMVIGEHLVSNQPTIIGKGMRLRIEQELQIMDIEDEIIPFNGVDVQWVETTAGRLRVPVDHAQLTGTMKTLSRHKNWSEYFALKEGVADLRPRDAATVYKAQGSTYDTVFVDLGNIGTCNIPSQAARMLYVACSRPTNKIYLYGQLPDKFRR